MLIYQRVSPNVQTVSRTEGNRQSRERLKFSDFRCKLDDMGRTLFQDWIVTPCYTQYWSFVNRNQLPKSSRDMSRPHGPHGPFMGPWQHVTQLLRHLAAPQVPGCRSQTLGALVPLVSVESNQRWCYKNVKIETLLRWKWHGVVMFWSTSVELEALKTHRQVAKSRSNIQPQDDPSQMGNPWQGLVPLEEAMNMTWLFSPKSANTTLKLLQAVWFCKGLDISTYVVKASIWAWINLWTWTVVIVEAQSTPAKGNGKPRHVLQPWARDRVCRQRPNWPDIEKDMPSSCTMGELPFLIFFMWCYDGKWLVFHQSWLEDNCHKPKELISWDVNHVQSSFV